VTAGQVAVAAGVVGVVAAYAGFSARWTADDPSWYARLPRPSWQPPDVVFGVIWPLNFVALVVSGVTVALQSAPRDGLSWLALFAASVALALGWAHEFYVPHRLGRAAWLLAGAAVLTWLLVVVTARAVPWAGWVLVPYALWLTVATSLAVGYWRLVPRAAVARS
jgi:tryptophan-rich sensory protein